MPSTRSALAAAACVLLASAAVGATAGSAGAAATGTWKNCTSVNHKYPHGVGRAGAHDKTSGTPVTNFRHSTKLYKTAMRHNKGLDRDKDGIACEKA
jgi:hypothetical protein